MLSVFLIIIKKIHRAHKKIKHCRVKMEGRLFEVGTMKFESLVDLVNFYIKFPLYRKVKLSYPVSKDIIKRLGNLSVSTFASTNKI